MTELLDIVGQDDALARLEGTVWGARRPHAYIFAGPRGVGRRTTATALAKTLLCEDPTTTPNAARLARLDADFPLRRACGQCTDCKMVAAGTHPDLHLVYKELARYHDDLNVRERVMQELGIDVIRDFLIGPACRSASRGRGKTFIVLEAELMSAAAQNALLKTLEEPPEGVTIILICQRSEELLPTTLSRCSMIRFVPLPKAFVIEKLLEQGIEREEAEFWAAFTGGSVGKAVDLADQDLYPIKRDVLERLAGLGPAGDAELADHLVKLMDKRADAAIAAARRADGSELSANLAKRQAVSSLLELIAGAYQDAMALAAGAKRQMVNADQQEAIERLARRFTSTQLAEIVEQLSQYEQLLWNNVNPKIVWDNAVVTCASAAPLRL